MNILLVNPATSDTRKGNHVTSDRIIHHLSELGHTVTLGSNYTEGDWDCLIALHAYKSAGTVEAFVEHHPEARTILMLTGTDVYRDLNGEPETLRSIERADTLVLLQPLAREELPPGHRDKARVVHQSVLHPPSTGKRPDGSDDKFVALSAAHLRDVKDPLRLAYAARELPESSSVKAYHLGGILEDSYRDKLESIKSCSRFEYLGEKPRKRTLEYIKGADVFVITSRLEGGANVVSEAISAGTPVLASDIPGNRGLLGEDYPGYFPVGDTNRLTELLLECEQNGKFRNQLSEAIFALRNIVDPEHERAQWKDVLQS